ncbi:MAG: helix-turn-helix transcriptional regulator, partial [Clostridia bacterium]|nr:helix-turn-helix transcriptional regulator [Clostridia bacterium]
MERKSIGSFIAILRKANGLTQRELADKLGVSDKAVSRWERDETAPDLYLIPVIAEIFGVTSDELLRGERAGESAPPPERQNEKTERQIKTVLKTVRTKFLTKTLICALIAVVGLLAAMLCNFAFYKAELGFFIGLIFFIVSVIVEIVFAVLAFSGLDAEEFEGAHLAETRKYIVKKTETLVFLAFGLFAFTLPLPIVASQTSYTDVSVNFDTWLFYGILCVALAALVCLFANIAVDKFAEKKGIYTVDEETVQRRSLAKFRFVSPLPVLAKIFLPIIAVTIVLHIVCLNVFDYEFFLRNQGTEWNDANDFVDYMESSVTSNGETFENDNVTYPTYKVWIHTENSSSEIKFEWRNRFVEDFNINGTTADDIASGHNGIIYTEVYIEGEKTDSYEEIYNIPDFHAITYSWNETDYAKGWAGGISVCFVLAYFAEIISLAVIYTVKVDKNFKKKDEH